MKKIMFDDNYCLTLAVLNGSKTMTRRVIACTALSVGGSVSILQDPDGKTRYLYMSKPNPKKDNVCASTEIFPRYKVGEEVAIAQSYKTIYNEMNVSESLSVFVNKNWYRLREGEPAWTNKMFVEATMMPHRIRITNVRAERLQKISEADAMREGIMKYIIDIDGKHVVTHHHSCYDGNLMYERTAREAFAELIDKVAKKGTWEDNPWCWVYEFELLK